MRWIAAAVAVVALVAGAFLVTGRPDGKPSSGDVKGAVDRLFGTRCSSRISVLDVHDLGGPGLPPQMRAAREIVCDADVAAEPPQSDNGRPTLAVDFVFKSDAAAREWMSGDDYQNGDWWLGNGTLVAAGGSLNHADWLKLRDALRLDPSGSP